MAGEATYVRVLPTFWTDPKVKRKLTRDQKHLLLYFFTSPHINLIGLYYLPLTYAEAESELPRADIAAWITEPLAPFVTYDHETEEILVHRAARHQIGDELHERDNRVKAVERILRDTHSRTLVARFLDLYPEWPVHAPAVPRDIRAPVPTGTPPSEGLPSPSTSPFEALAVADAGTDADAELKELLLPPRAHTPEELESIEQQIDSVIIAANTGMASNRLLKSFNPIPPGHGSRQDVRDWLAAGVDRDVVIEVVTERAEQFKPEGRNRQIHSMKYFTSAVLDEHERRIAREKTHERRNGAHRGRGPAATTAATPRTGDPRRRRGFGT